MAPLNKTDTIGVGTDVTVTGWGKPSDSASGISPVLRTVDVKTISNADCKSTFAIVTDGIVCIDTAGGKGSCNVNSLLFFLLDSIEY